MNEYLILGALLASGTSIVATIRFWMDMGKAHAAADEAKAQATLMAAKLEFLSANVNEFKVAVAQTYATAKALDTAEQSLSQGIERSIQGIYQRLDQMTSRLDNLITIANRKEPE